MRTLLAAALMGVALTTTGAAAAKFQPAVVYDTGGKFDKSFNESAYHGAEKFQKETGIKYREFEVTAAAQREQALRNMARHGASVVVGIGFAQATPMDAVAKEFPKTKFCIIDGVVNEPNVQSILFREHEGSFLVGMLGAMASKTGKVGFVGGMDIPLIRNFLAGYEQGVKHVKSGDDVIANFVGTTDAAWNDPARGTELAKSQFDRGVDVVYAAAGNSGTGVLSAANGAKKLSIGVDSDQNYLFPGSVLTSMVKHVDVAVYDCMKTAMNGTWKPGLRSLGLKEGGVDFALDQYNRKLVTPEMEKAVDKAKAEIISGALVVKPYKQ